MKGDSGTLGYPEVGAAADSLCRLLEHTPDLAKIPLAIVDQHVDAVRAIVREHGRADIAAIATALTGKLRAVTDEFLIKENRHRPDVLKAIQSPTLAHGRVVLSDIYPGHSGRARGARAGLRGDRCRLGRDRMQVGIASIRPSATSSSQNSRASSRAASAA